MTVFPFWNKIFLLLGKENMIRGPKCYLRTQTLAGLSGWLKRVISHLGLHHRHPWPHHIPRSFWQVERDWHLWMFSKELYGQIICIACHLGINYIWLAGLGHREVLKYRHVRSTHVLFLTGGICMYVYTIPTWIMVAGNSIVIQRFANATR